MADKGCSQLLRETRGKREIGWYIQPKSCVGVTGHLPFSPQWQWLAPNWLSKMRRNKVPQGQKLAVSIQQYLRIW